MQWIALKTIYVVSSLSNEMDDKYIKTNCRSNVFTLYLHRLGLFCVFFWGGGCGLQSFSAFICQKCYVLTLLSVPPIHAGTCMRDMCINPDEELPVFKIVVHEFFIMLGIKLITKNTTYY